MDVFPSEQNPWNVQFTKLFFLSFLLVCSITTQASSQTYSILFFSIICFTNSIRTMEKKPTKKCCICCCFDEKRVRENRIEWKRRVERESERKRNEFSSFQIESFSLNKWMDGWMFERRGIGNLFSLKTSSIFFISMNWRSFSHFRSISLNLCGIFLSYFFN